MYFNQPAKTHTCVISFLNITHTCVLTTGAKHIANIHPAMPGPLDPGAVERHPGSRSCVRGASDARPITITKCTFASHNARDMRTYIDQFSVRWFDCITARRDQTHPETFVSIVYI